MQMTFQQLEDRSVNFVEVCIYTELGCDPSEGEYSMIKDCIENNFEEIELAKEGCTQVILKESGEWEDVFWHKYYVIERVCAFEA